MKTVEELHSELEEVRQKLSVCEGNLTKAKSEAVDERQAHRGDIHEIVEYQGTNARLVAALQEIADGSGKYAKIARDALSK